MDMMDTGKQVSIPKTYTKPNPARVFKLSFQRHPVIPGESSRYVVLSSVTSGLIQ